MNKVKTKTSWMSFQNLLFKNVIYLLTKLAWMNVFFTSIVLDLQKDTLRYIQHIVINKHMLLRCLRSPVFHWPEAVAGPTAFNVVSSVMANFTSGKHLKALHVTSLTASLVFVCTSWVRRGLNFPRCKRTIAYLIFFDQYDFIWLKWICIFIVD